ncbi:terpene cyclase/mutase family protein [bacterium]|nr:terpene cyclase/mutase family protein [bacterium]
MVSRLSSSIGLLLLCLSARGGTLEPVARVALSDGIRDSAIKGLRYLAATQNRDGSWTSGARMGRNVGVSALACMAFMANGSQPGRGEFGEHIERGLDFVLNHVRRDGYIVAGANSRMYEHGFATLFLAQAYGMTPRQDIADKLRLAAGLILRSQKRVDGGWRYDPTPLSASDISVTVCQILALRAARNCGIKVPAESIGRAIAYVKASCLPDGYFCYLKNSRTRGSYALLASGLNCLFGAGEYDCPELKRALVRFEEQTPRHISKSGRISHYYFYAHYYASQAAYHAGGRYWAAYYPQVTRELLRQQAPSGSWQSNYGNAYATAMACLILQLPYQYLPIFQRLGVDEISAKEEPHADE